MNQRKSLPDNLLQNICEEFNKLLGMQTLNWFRRLTAPIIKIPTGHFAESVEEFTDWDQTKESAPKWGEIGNRKSLTRWNLAFSGNTFPLTPWWFDYS